MRTVSLLVTGLLLSVLAAGAEPAGCGISKGLYDGWLALAKHASAPVPKAEALIAGAPSAAPEPDKRLAIGKEYRSFFQCVADAAERQDKEAILGLCKQVESDRPAFLACRTAAYLKSGRTDTKDFMDALPTGKKGAELFWDLEEIAGGWRLDSGGWRSDSGTLGMFLPNGPAYKLIDELFLLVLDDKETAAAKYFNIAAFASGGGGRHIDDQMKLLMCEAPAIVVKRWMVLRQYQPKLKKLLAELASSLPPTELQKMRKALGAFCGKDNPDCPEIVKLFGRAD